MEATASQETEPRHRPFLVRLLFGLLSFLFVPLIVLALLAGMSYYAVTEYQAQHEDRIYTGVDIWNIDVSGLTADEARTKLTNMIPAAQETTVTIADPNSGREWIKSSSELGVHYDVEQAIQQAYDVGRSGAGLEGQLRGQFAAWYYGRSFAPQAVIDEAYLDQFIAAVSAEIETPAIDATLDVQGADITYSPPQNGLMVDRAAIRQQLLPAVASLQNARAELPLVNLNPRVAATGESAETIAQMISSPITFYFEKPVDGVDLKRIELSPNQLGQWLGVQMVEQDGGGLAHEVVLDEVAARNWIAQFETDIAREAERARFYFDDYTQELVLVEPHITGRFLDVEATLERLLTTLESPNRSVPLVVHEILPDVHSNSTGAELGIIEQTTEATTYFADSSNNRIHNIAHGASNFYGIIIGPGEEFSFNRFLGEISLESGYKEGLIISGGRTIAGVGGGICQVSTTLFQTAFWAGLAIRDRQEHGYRVHYYEQGLGPDGQPNIGMDATIYTPILDFKFTNDTEHYLLIENYFSDADQSLTFKFYSTDIGRKVERSVSIWNEQPPNPNVYEFSDQLNTGQIEQVDWAVEGAEVQVERIVYNYLGEVRHNDFYNSSYKPWQNVYQYGPDADLSIFQQPEETPAEEGAGDGTTPETPTTENG